MWVSPTLWKDLPTTQSLRHLPYAAHTFSCQLASYLLAALNEEEGQDLE